jgi:hypothetical protein
MDEFELMDSGFESNQAEFGFNFKIANIFTGNF